MPEGVVYIDLTTDGHNDGRWRISHNDGCWRVHLGDHPPSETLRANGLRLRRDQAYTLPMGRDTIAISLGSATNVVARYRIPSS